jgi:antitoxin (DNA-binding transcriptional repressor) of toxin-antitoxin stability system
VDIQHSGELLLELIELALEGEEVIILRDRRPLVKLEALPPLTGRRSFGSAKGLITLREDFDDPLEDFKESRDPSHNPSADEGPQEGKAAA